MHAHGHTAADDGDPVADLLDLLQLVEENKCDSHSLLNEEAHQTIPASPGESALLSAHPESGSSHRETALLRSPLAASALPSDPPPAYQDPHRG